MGSMLRDAALAAAGAGDEAGLLLPDLSAETRRLAGVLGEASASAAAERTLRSAERLDRNLREELVVESFLLSIGSERAASPRRGSGVL
jgi:hypothetical protein